MDEKIDLDLMILNRFFDVFLAQNLDSLFLGGLRPKNKRDV